MIAAAIIQQHSVIPAFAGMTSKESGEVLA